MICVKYSVQNGMWRKSVSKSKKELNKEVHPSHKMTRWESTIVTLVSTSRFGQIRKCKKCGGEQAATSAGSATHDELKVKCWAEK
jgi:hypothetical protein